MKIKQAAENLNVSQQTIRNWIDYFDIPIERNSKNQRIIDEDSYEYLEYIAEQLNEGLTKEDILNQFDDEPEETTSNQLQENDFEQEALTSIAPACIRNEVDDYKAGCSQSKHKIDSNLAQVEVQSPTIEAPITEENSSSPMNVEHMFLISFATLVNKNIKYLYLLLGFATVLFIYQGYQVYKLYKEKEAQKIPQHKPIYAW